jgi:lactate racemase
MQGKLRAAMRDYSHIQRLIALPGRRSTMMEALIAYGRGHLPISVPDGTCVLAPEPLSGLPEPGTAIAAALAQPIGGLPLPVLARALNGGTVCVVVSDITRPVPYRVILPVLLGCLEANGVPREKIMILIATGMHRPSTVQERHEMFGADLCAQYDIQDHDATDPDCMVELPSRTSVGTAVSVDRRYVEADLKIATGLVEPHFMAGYSGGRKAICPGLVDLATIQRFHGPGFLESPSAATGVLGGNPCHRESSDVAHIVGVDFLLNVTLNLQREIAGVFAGDLDEAFLAAVAHVETCSQAWAAEEADVVITSGGGYPLDTTFYQVVKGMVGALPVVREGGTIVAIAPCDDGIGSETYRDIMFTYADRPDDFLADIKGASTVARDQWELEMQCRCLRKVGKEGLVLCAEGIPLEDAARLTLVPAPVSGDQRIASIQAAVDAVIARHGEGCRVAVIPEGPYVMTGVRSCPRARDG